MHAATRRGFAALIVGAAATALGIGAAPAQVVIQERVMPAPLVETIPVGARSDLPLGAGLLEVERSLGLGQGPLRRRVVVPAMPAAIVETPPASPGPGWFWVRGHYVWERGGWVWRGGHWVR